MAFTALQTDLYELTMIAGYVVEGVHEHPATFELFVRRLPENRAFLVAAGLDTALEYLEALSFDQSELDWLRSLPSLRNAPSAFFEHLRRLHFTGDVWAMAEGTPFFPNEPVLRITAPLAEAQLVETALLSIVNFQTSIASKAARIVSAAEGRPIIEFGSRRAHGPSAGLYAARAAYIGGCVSTSFVAAGRAFDIPLSGTMAHSWVQAFESEEAAFESFMRTFGSQSVLLLDTYDTGRAARTIVSAGLRPSAVRLDSGDLLELSQQVRGIFDAGGLTSTQILVSGELDEHRISELLGAGAPIDGFGVGTALTTSEDAPALGGVYKMVQVSSDGRTRNVMKHSPGKSTWPGRKQVHRVVESCVAAGDVIALDDEQVEGRSLLGKVMENGKRVAPRCPLSDTRTHAQALIAELPRHLRRIDARPTYEVRSSDRLARLIADLGG